jgi:photosystem II stability/assembly factor-like uncharacterized protein
MTKVPLLEAETPDTHLDSTPFTSDVEALFREARRRRRRRRAAASAGLVCIVAVVLGSVWLAAGGGSNGRRGADTRHQRPPHAAAQSKQSTHAAGPLPVYPPAQVIGVANNELDWAATGDSVKVTSDGGRSWQTATPPTLHGVTVSIHITALAAVGTEDLWVAIYDVPGLASQPNNGSSRGEGIERSTDGGQSWSFVSPPGCLQTCGPLSLSMVDSENGYAVASGAQGQGSPLFSTHDGGATWTQIATMPSLGGVAVGGPLEGSQLVFTNNLDGWAVPGTYPSYNQPQQTPGGVIYRTTDGGFSWSAVDGLPRGLQYTLPAFFGTQVAVTLATKGTNYDRDPVVFVTHDAGATWTGYPIPIFEGSQFQPGSVATRFAAVGPLHWRIDVGSLLYETTDAGKTWRSIKPTPAVGVGDAEGVTFASPSFGLAIEQNPVCFSKAALDQPDYNCYPVLTTTSDGGRSWTPANP